jgi:hypothetical protein
MDLVGFGEPLGECIGVQDGGHTAHRSLIFTES